ncbi:hypothetical protein FACS1894199_06160 [Bacteroidia bacterium]|nr:hypothetical protein FACS1894199_06160 [Bacteroidia bacterium]
MFFENSKKIANDFLQSIVFLDDEAFKNSESQHAFDASEISKAFAKEKKVCAVYNPKTSSDINDFVEIAKKADVVILDWKILITEEVTPETAEDDAPAEEPRGQYTLSIIQDLIKPENAALKLIIIYTGEDILDDITDGIAAICSSQGTFIKSACELSFGNIRILIRAKSNNAEIDNRFTQRPHLQDKVLSYADLPSFVLEEFTKMTAGLLSDFALLALTTVRDNSYKILHWFSKDLDAAYMGHKVVLPVQNDAEELLPKLFGDTIVDLLLYNEIHKKSDINLTDWLNEKITENDVPITNKQGNVINPQVKYKRDIELLKNLVFSTEKNVEKRFENQFKTLVTDKKQREGYLEYLLKNTTTLFENENNKRLEIDRKFAILTHHKSLFMPKTIVPKLTLGTVIRSSKNQSNYYICIQQRCDSVRLKRDEERKFLFLPLVSTTDKFHIITPEGVKLKLDKESYSIKTIKFKCNRDEGEIRGSLENTKYFFKENYDNGDKFEWILDLKDLHSQRIVTNYVSSLSRIGLDESEWLRMAGGN